MSDSLNIASLQLPSLSYDSGKIDYYMTIAKRENVKVFVLGEYVLSLFFKDLENSPISFINEQSKHHIEALKKMAKVYNMHIVAPIVTVYKKKPKKILAVFTPTSMKKYEQQILMDYKHWNEEKFFNNEKQEEFKPLIFTVDGIKLGVIFGYELHFDHIWAEFRKKGVDCVIMPTVSTFESSKRWRDITRTRAFLNQYYVLRVNRIGSHMEKDTEWKFYGDSFFCNPYGEIEDYLGSKEELLFSTVKKEVLKTARSDWKFQKTNKTLGL
ncbi:MAG: carbon-nitrogen hydrolase family protein [Campylobacterales bacterium]|nr:carbon-nitrogen hydrolase family protein [Campylobacterales bacterium]